MTPTIGAVVTGSEDPGASTQNQGDTGDFTIPADGYYCLGAIASNAQAANSDVLSSAQLMVRNT